MGESVSPWFKVWGKESVGSLDLQSLSDHEFRVFWNLMFIGSIQEPRWFIQKDERQLARLCGSTPPKFRAAVGVLARRGMVKVSNEFIQMINAEKWQETPEARRQRLKRERDRQRNADRDKGRDALRDMSRSSHGDTRAKPEERGQRRDPDPPDDSLRSSSTPAADADLVADPIAEFRDTVLSRLPGKWQRDELTWDEVESLGRDYAGRPDWPRELAEAIDECRRNEELPFPSKLRKYLPEIPRKVVKHPAAQRAPEVVHIGFDALGPPEEGA